MKSPVHCYRAACPDKCKAYLGPTKDGNPRGTLNKKPLVGVHYGGPIDGKDCPWREE